MERSPTGSSLHKALLLAAERAAEAQAASRALIEEQRAVALVLRETVEAGRRRRPHYRDVRKRTP
jgi:hypothetical protein